MSFAMIEIAESNDPSVTVDLTCNRTVKILILEPFTDFPDWTLATIVKDEVVVLVTGL